MSDDSLPKLYEVTGDDDGLYLCDAHPDRPDHTRVMRIDLAKKEITLVTPYVKVPA